MCPDSGSGVSTAMCTFSESHITPVPEVEVESDGGANVCPETCTLCMNGLCMDPVRRRLVGEVDGYAAYEIPWYAQEAYN